MDSLSSDTFLFAPVVLSQATAKTSFSRLNKDLGWLAYSASVAKTRFFGIALGCEIGLTFGFCGAACSLSLDYLDATSALQNTDLHSNYPPRPVLLSA
jgi:hypothetical protein